MSLRDRKSQIRSLVPQVKILFRHHGVPTAFEVPGSKIGTVYHVEIPNKILEKTLTDGTQYYEYHCTCHDSTLPGEWPECRGNSASGNRKDTVCKHCIAALINRLERTRQVEVSICDWSDNGRDIDNAKLALRFGGCLLKLVSNQSDGQVWLVGRKRLEQKPQQDEMTIQEHHARLEHNTNLLRGPKREPQVID